MTKKNENETKVVCPVCGTEFAIGEHSHHVSGQTIAKDSGLGTVYPEVAKIGAGGVAFVQQEPGFKPALKKADDRIAALKKAGIDTSNLFAVQSASGNGIVVRLKNGVPETVEDDDPVWAAIIKSGTVPDRRLFRRWVMSQMFHMLDDKTWEGRKGYTVAMHRKGYEYTWKMTLEELRVQARLARNNDTECFIQRNRWFNREVAVNMADSYLDELYRYVSSLPIKHCKRVPYVTIHGQHIFTSDLWNKVYSPLAVAKKAIVDANSPQKLYDAFTNFNRLRKPLPWGTKQDDLWVDAYKGAGAYFTLQNLIRFHGVFMKTASHKKVFGVDALTVLESKATSHEGWKLLGLLKEVLCDNGIDVTAERHKWAAERQARSRR